LVDFKKLKENRESYRERMRKKEELERITACFTGHRSDKIGGYDMNNPTALKVKEKLSEVIRSLILDEGITRFISGGALGVDTYAFGCVHKLKDEFPHIQNILSVPFLQQDKVWNDYQKRVYARMKEIADEIIYVDKLYPYKIYGIEEDTYHIAKMQKRNEHIVDHSRIVIAVWDGSKGGTANCVRYARDRTLYRIFPSSLELEIRYGING
jgi:uncharacterized phage-like protein YoqJ